MNITPYSLPDLDIISKDVPDYSLHIWHPDKIYLILGQSNKADKSLIAEQVEYDNITVMKRPSGGETVILTPKTLVISTIVTTVKFENTKSCFKQINSIIINRLETLGIKNLCQRGISDISIGEKKILGSSMYRKVNKVFYHAVLNVAESTDIMEKYIAHPLKEPDYRLGRSHKEFVTSLYEQGYKTEFEFLIKLLQD